MVVGTWLFGHVLTTLAPEPGRAADVPTAGEADEAPGEGPVAAEAVEAATPEKPEATDDAPAAPAEDRPPLRYHDTLLYTNYVGLGGGARFGRRETEAVPVDMSAGTDTTATGVASVQGRLAGFTSGTPRFGRGKRILTPELFVSIEFGGTRRAVEGGAPARPAGVAVGAQGVLRLGLGRTMGHRKVSPYAKVQLDGRFAAYVRDTAEGNFLLATLRASGGILGRSQHQGFVLLAGGAIDGVAGAQALGRRSSVAQVMAGGELGIYAHPTARVFFGWVGDARATIAGERYGGRRVEWRATFDLMLGLPLTQARPRYLSLFAMYWGTEIRAAVGVQPVTAGERRLGHAVLAGFGVGI